DCAAVRVRGNDLRGFGLDGSPLPDSAGIHVTGAFNEVVVAENVARLGTTPSAGASRWRALWIGELPSAPAGEVTLAAEHRLQGLLGRRPTAPQPTAAAVAREPVSLPFAHIVSVTANLLEAVGPARTVEIGFAGPCTFAHNQCLRGPSTVFDNAIVSLNA